MGYRESLKHPFALGVVLVITLTIPAVIIYDVVTGGPEPPPWGGDIVPGEQWVCDNSPEGVTDVAGYNAFWARLGWPEWPEPIAVERCPDKAPPDVAMWTACNEDCPSLAGATLIDWETGSVTIRTQPALHTTMEQRTCLPLHEAGHARGLADPSDGSRHTDAASNLMAERCGSSLRWLDRTEEGDWPY